MNIWNDILTIKSDWLQRKFSWFFNDLIKKNFEFFLKYKSNEKISLCFENISIRKKKTNHIFVNFLNEKEKKRKKILFFYLQVVFFTHFNIVEKFDNFLK